VSSVANRVATYAGAADGAGNVTLSNAPTVTITGGTDIAGVRALSLDTLGAGIGIQAGTPAATVGSATLVAGAPSQVTVLTTAVTAFSLIFHAKQLSASVPATNGSLYILARTPGTSFTIASTNAADDGAVAWWIVEPLP
jgi:hypothetical protein